MKKNKLFTIVGTFVVVLFAMLLCNFQTGTKHAFAENLESSTTVGISQISQITDLSANYYLESNIVLEDFDQTIENFKGTLNGNGYIISGSMKAPLFNRLEKGAHVFNLSFTNVEYKIQSTETAEQNIGLVAGVIEGATISQIKVNNVHIKTDVVGGGLGINVTPHALLANTNMGVLVGKVTDGSLIQNSSIENVQLSVLIGNTQAQSFNFGGIAGILNGGRLTNNILVLNNTESKNISFESDTSKVINFGGLVGYSCLDKNYIYNNILILDITNIAFSDALTTKNVGAIVGELAIEPYVTNIEGFLTTFTEDAFGKKVTNQYSYKKINQLSFSDIDNSIFTNENLWNDLDSSKWDYDKVWVNQSGLKFPILQCYQKYALSFDISESSKSLNLEVMPEGDVVKANVSIEGKQNNDVTSLTGIDYNSTVHIKVDIINEKNYNNFFFISGLQLNGKTIYDNVNNTKASNIDISVLETQAVGVNNSYTYVINGFTANCAGTYNVLLGRNTYKLNVKVLDIGTEETGSIIPGKFKTNLNTNHVVETVLELQYGEKYILNTVVTDTDYSDRANWFLYKNIVNEVQEGIYEFEKLNLDISEEYANFYGNKVEIIFNENCVLFSPSEPNPNSTYFVFDNYLEAEIDNDYKSVYDLYIVYNKRVKEIKITFKYDNNEIINQNIAKLLIDNKSDRLVWSEADGVYYAKVAFTKGVDTDYTIRIDQLSTEFEFDDWYIGTEKLTDVDDNELAGVFSVNELTEEPVEIFCVFKYDADVGNNLLWLWITLGVVGGVGLIVLIIFIIKRRKGGGGGSSYKKYYY